MENHRYRESKKMAEPNPDLSNSGLSKLSRYEENPSDRRRRELNRRDQRKSLVSKPTVEISIHQDQPGQHFTPQSILSAEYTVKLAPDTSMAAIESSVIWMTEGKGEEDIGVHFFERRNRASFAIGTFDRPQRLSTVLPQSPLSYDGRILKVRWLVRIRLFLAGGREFIFDRQFQLSINEELCQWVETE